MGEATNHSNQISRITPALRGLPGRASKTLDILTEVVTEEGFAVEIVPVTLDPESPTILLDSKDLFPQERGEVRTHSCRIYFTPEGPKNHPTATMVCEALEKGLSGSAS